ncbi:hypothetical protein SAMN02799624_06666 [Paenibacillus sp. UNC496MF]|nr:hypothetical protein SAMN02799624_06666 [Paenibacillus sp. UNC496MF]
MVLSVAGGNLLFLADSPFERTHGGRVISLSLTYSDEAEARSESKDRNQFQFNFR